MAKATKAPRKPRIADAAPGPPAGRRRPWRLLAGIAVLIVFGGFLPGIVARTPLLNWIVAKAADLDGTVSLRSASLGWFSPVVLSEIVIADNRQQAVLELAEVRSERSLWQFLTDRSAYGTFRLQRPKITVVLEADGSNVERVLARYLTSTQKSQVGAFTLEIVDGQILVVDQPTRRNWTLDQVQLTLDMPSGSPLPTKLDIAAQLADARQPGSLAVKLASQPREPSAAPTLENTAGELVVEAEAIPLDMFERLVARIVPDARLSGSLASKIGLQWNGSQQAAAQAEVHGGAIAFGAKWLGTDLVRLDRTDAVCRMNLEGRRLQVQQSTLECDVGSVAVSGTIDMDDRTLADLSGTIWHQACDIRGTIDLARLARLLPGTLRIRQGTEITSGQVNFLVQNSGAASGDPASPEGGRLIVQLETDRLTATDQGRPLEWQRPIRLAAAVRQSPQGPVVETVQVESDFLKANASGTPDRLTASLNFNLKTLTDELGRFVDLGGLSLAGEGEGTLRWNRSADLAFATDAELQVRGFRLTIAAQQPWTEETLVVAMAGRGRTDFTAQTRLDAASLDLRSGSDRIVVQLAQPIADLRDGGTWPLTVQAQGQLAGWPARMIAMAAPKQAVQMSGGYQLSGQVVASKDGATFQDGRLATTSLALASPWINLNEPQAILVAAGRWDRPARRWVLDKASLASSALVAEGKDLALVMPEKEPWGLSGELSYRGDLGRIGPWFTQPGKPPSWQVSGQAAGTASVRPVEGKIRAWTDSQITQLAVVTNAGQQFQEPNVRLVAQATYLNESGELRLDQLELGSQTIGARIANQTAAAGGATDQQLVGELGYNWDRICGLFVQPYMGQRVRVSGQGAGPAWYRGPLWPVKGEGAASLRWQAADVFAFKIGPGELKTHVAGGVVQTEPVELACSGGRLRLAPCVRVDPAPMELTLPAGPLAQQVQIDRAMCEAALKYIAPVMAEITTAQGAFSIELDNCRVPLADPTKSDIRGRLIIHSVEVGPGPLVRELAVLLNRAEPARLKRESKVPFQMVDGRVYHQGLELQFSELTIRTTGYVGVDQSLAIVAELPMPTKWLARMPGGERLQNQAIRLPIAGTLGRPKLDPKEIARVTAGLFNATGVRTLEQEVGKQLDRLLKPPSRQ